MKKALWMILAVCLLAVYANAATVTIALNEAGGKYFITAQVTEGSYGIAGFKITGNSGDFTGARNASPVVKLKDLDYDEDYAWCGFSLFRSAAPFDAVIEGAQDTPAVLGEFDNSTGSPREYTIWTLPVLDHYIGVTNHDLSFAIGVIESREGNNDSFGIESSELSQSALPVVLVDNIASKPTLKIGDTLETLEPMVSGTTYPAGKVGTLANVFVNGTDNDTEAASIKFVDNTIPAGANVTCTVNLQNVDYADPTAVPVWVWIDGTLQPVQHLNGSNQFTLTGVALGAHTIAVKAPHWLHAEQSVNITGSMTVASPFNLLNGDVNGDDFIDEVDFGIMSGNWYQDDTTWSTDASDINGDGFVDEVDFGIMSGNWYLGDATYTNP